ncbi:hypothetical protein Drorol1_Dr00026364 [Drosera rotundifolia]
MVKTRAQSRKMAAAAPSSSGSPKRTHVITPLPAKFPTEPPPAPCPLLPRKEIVYDERRVNNYYLQMYQSEGKRLELVEVIKAVVQHTGTITYLTMMVRDIDTDKVEICQAKVWDGQHLFMFKGKRKKLLLFRKAPPLDNSTQSGIPNDPPIFSEDPSSENMMTMPSPLEGPACSDVTVMREMPSSSEAPACSEDTAVMMTMPSSSEAPACSEDTAMMTMPSSLAGPAYSEDVAMMMMPSPLESPACPENTIKMKMPLSFEADASPGDMVVMMPSTSGVPDSSREMKKDHNNLFGGSSGLGTDKKETVGSPLATWSMEEANHSPHMLRLFTFTTPLFPSNKPMFSDTSSFSKTCKCHGVCSCTERKGPSYIRDDRFDEIMQEYRKRVEKREMLEQLVYSDLIFGVALEVLLEWEAIQANEKRWGHVGCCGEMWELGVYCSTSSLSTNCILMFRCVDILRVQGPTSRVLL